MRRPVACLGASGRPRRRPFYRTTAGWGYPHLDEAGWPQCGMPGSRLVAGPVGTL